MNLRGGWSWRRAVGITKAKRRIDRAVGVPLFSKTGRDAWVGRKVLRLFGLK